MAESKTPVTPPRIPQRVVDLPGGPRSRSEDAEGKRLIVGRDISLNGEIASCDTLVIEGRVEATLSDCTSFEIAGTGRFKGTAEVQLADIRGRFDGSLTVRERLMIRATGRVTGQISYGELEVERGGKIDGEVRVLDDTAALPGTVDSERA